MMHLFAHLFVCPVKLDLCREAACREDYCQNYGMMDERAYDRRECADYYRSVGHSLQRAAAERAVLALLEENNTLFLSGDKSREYILIPRPQRRRGYRRERDQERLDDLVRNYLAKPEFASRLEVAIDAIVREWAAAGKRHRQ
jgi:hypothetical protein